MFYSLFVAGALAWGLLAGRPWLVLDPQRSTWGSAALGALEGLALGLLVVGLSRFCVARYRWSQDLYCWFASILGALSTAQVLALAGLSAVGEELLFRGAMQPTLGLWLTSAIFALMHFPSQRRFWPWTLAAGLMGISFGLITLHTANLAGAILSHFIINALNLKHVSRFAAVGDVVKDVG